MSRTIQKLCLEVSRRQKQFLRRGQRVSKLDWASRQLRALRPAGFPCIP